MCSLDSKDVWSSYLRKNCISCPCCTQHNKINIQTDFKWFVGFLKKIPFADIATLVAFEELLKHLALLFLKLIHYSLINSRGWVKSNFWIINFGAFASNLLWWYQPTASLSNWPSQTEEMRLVLWNNRFLASIRASFFFN